MRFSPSKLSMAVFLATTSLAYAQENTVNLDVVSVVSENAGAKSRTNVVTLKDLNKGTKEDLRGVLSAEPAINFGGGTGGTSQWTTIRGMGQDQIDIKVDNTYSDAQIFHHQSRFMLDPSLIKRIDVRKGAGSASAGIGATSGSIEATTVDAKDLLREGQDFGFKLNAGVSSNKGHSQGASVYGKSGAFDALLSGNWETAENYKGGKGYSNKEGSDTVKNSALGQRGLLAKFGVDINEDHRVVLSHRQERYHGERALREEFDFSQDWTTTASLTSEQRAAGYQLGAAAGVDRNGRPTRYLLDKNGALVANDANNDPRYRITTQNTTNLEYIGKNLGLINEVKANAYLLENSREETDTNSKTKVVTKGANINFDSEIGSDHFVKYGVNYRHQEGKPNSLEAFAENRRTRKLEATGVTNNQEKEDIGAYVEGIWGFGPVTMTTGLRYDHFDFKANDGKKVSDGAFSPSVGLIWEVVQGLSLNTNLNYATRSPRFYEVALSGSTARSVADDLKAEKARNTEIGFNYDFNDQISLNGSYFWQKVKDAHAVLNNTLVNSALLRNKGYELGAAYKYSGFTFRLGVADSKPETWVFNDASLDSTVYAVATGRTWTTGLSYKFENPSLEIGWKGRFVEGETGTPSRGSNATTAPVKQSGYGVNDFYASWDANKNLTLNFAVNNAFNKNYKSHSQRAGATSLPSAGRDFRVNVNYIF
ncbi:iron-regulated outer membrane protein [Actinobacillus lignieresii]|uniref:TonB-dependent receptor domain-containing protein n=1 Tax=Actinobacillus lignieresii TaxID=720 RepID=UPI000E19023E|nr:TonB-dependent receptor [Actinobacillus lignieresii]SUT98891.1 iron-regulated outer membrane protein [Actinobacillus lignieresii]